MSMTVGELIDKLQDMKTWGLVYRTDEVLVEHPDAKVLMNIKEVVEDSGYRQIVIKVGE